MNENPSISVFFPCYNDAKSISQLVNDALSTLKALTKNYEVIVIDDGSEDQSRMVLKKLAKRHRKIKIILHEMNLGYGAVLRTGFRNAKYDLVFYTDGDGQYDVRELPILFGLLGDGADFVNGIKSSRNDPLHRIFMGNLYSFVNRWLFWLPIYDVDCDFRLIRKTLLNKLSLQSSSGSIGVELVKKAERAGARFAEVSVSHYKRKYGVSQFFTPKNLFETAVALMSLWLDLMVLEKLKPQHLEYPQE